MADANPGPGRGRRIARPMLLAQLHDPRRTQAVRTHTVGWPQGGRKTPPSCACLMREKGKDVAKCYPYVRTKLVRRAAQVAIRGLGGAPNRLLHGQSTVSHVTRNIETVSARPGQTIDRVAAFLLLAGGTGRKSPICVGSHSGDHPQQARLTCEDTGDA